MKQIYISLSLDFNVDDDFDINDYDLIEESVDILLKDAYILDVTVEHMEET